MSVDQSYEMLREDELRNLFPNISKSTIEANNADGPKLRPAKPERAQGVPLDGAGKGKETGSPVSGPRYRITFAVFAVKPLDWDNYRLKDLQDCLIEAGFLPDDNWRVLEGQVISKKAHSKEEERTEILIESI